ncbi:lytic transglycosylase domain-containing protein [Burkholderiaceae bacterium DAT-1]|nr:lytic transglycosylase domain-containing protein [Burkholderiaceae bacterium DAT-1]
MQNRTFLRAAFALAIGLFSLASVQASVLEDMSAAKEAAQNRQITRLDDIANRLRGTALAIYPEYWQVSLQIDTLPDQEIRQFLDRYPDSWLAEKLRGEWLRNLGMKRKWPTFAQEWPRLQQWDVGSDVHCYRLQMGLANNEQDAIQTAKTLWFSDKGLPDPCAPLFDQLFARGVLDQDDVWSRIRLALAANHADFAEALLPRLKRADGLDVKRMRLATQKTSKFLAKLDLSSRGSRELAMYATILVARKDAQDAMSHFLQYEKHLGQSDRQYMYTKLAAYAARQRMPDSLSWFAKGLPASQVATEDAEWRVRAALRSGKWEFVAYALNALPPAKQNESAWQFWRARMLAETGHRLEANAIYASLSGSFDYYGLLSRDELGAVADVTTGRYRPNEDELQAVRSRHSIERALALYTLDWRTEAVREWNWAMRGMDDRQLIAAADIARQNGWYDRAIYSAERTRTIHDFNLRYLSPYRDVTQVYARQAGVDEAWVYGLIRQESRFVSAAKSGVGARGLMQVMPATAKWLAKKLGLGSMSPSAINELGTNVQLGTYYLKHVLGSLGNQPVLATAAYNAGPGRARAWQDNERALDGAIYIETIPFFETRDYVKKVMANSVFYARTFGYGETSLKRRLGTIPVRGSSATEDLPDPTLDEAKVMSSNT